jgi:hypothetical protein
MIIERMNIDLNETKKYHSNIEWARRKIW